MRDVLNEQYIYCKNNVRLNEEYQKVYMPFLFNFFQNDTALLDGAVFRC